MARIIENWDLSTSSGGQVLSEGTTLNSNLLFNIIWQPTTGAIVFKSTVAKFVKINPYGKTLISSSVTTSHSYKIGWDYDANKAIGWPGGSLDANKVISLFDENTGQLTTPITQPIKPTALGNTPEVIAFFKKDNHIFMMLYDSYAGANYNLAKFSLNGDLVFKGISPYGSIGWDMCYSGGNSLIVSSSAENILVEVSMDNFESMRTISVPSHSGIQAGRKKYITSDLRGNLFLIGYSNTSGTFTVYKLDLSTTPSRLIIERNPDRLSGNGRGIGVITARVLDDTGYPVSGVYVTCEPDGPLLEGAELLDTNGVSNVNGAVEFRYKAPNTTGIQNFNIKAEF